MAVPSFFKGAVVNPGADTIGSMELQIIKMIKKIENGAQFFQTQAIFDAEVFEKFMEKSGQQYQPPVLAGVILLKSEKMARYMNKFVPGIMVPDKIIEKWKNLITKSRLA
jgi:methylenetetrahydrofolate reductase (NADPH)